jgi:GNAT superfamily N-acetyltransferase
MAILELVQTSHFDQDMDRLRRECYPGAYPTGSSKDEFDDESVHIVARADGQVAGAGRLIPRPTRYYLAKSQGFVVVPDDPSVVYWGRLMVAPAHRGHDIFELLMVQALLHAREAGFRFVFGGMRPGRRFGGFLNELGFHAYGDSYLAHFPQGDELDQPLKLDIHEDHDWETRKRAIVARLQSKGYEMRLL